MFFSLRLKFHKWRWGVFERKANRIITSPSFKKRQAQWKRAMDAAQFHFNETGKLMDELYARVHDA